MDPAAAARWARGWAGPLAAVSHTLVLCAIEELLHNPYTDQDLILRLPGLWLAIHLLRWSAAGPALERPPSAVHLAAFFVGLGAASVLVLGGNLILLLYNLGWLSPFAPVLLVATLVLLAALRRAALPAPASRAPLVSTLVELGRFFLFTFGPAAMAIRYGLSHARALPLSALAGGIAVVGALVFGLRAARARLSPAERAPPRPRAGPGPAAGAARRVRRPRRAARPPRQRRPRPLATVPRGPGPRGRAPRLRPHGRAGRGATAERGPVEAPARGPIGR